MLEHYLRMFYCEHVSKHEQFTYSELTIEILEQGVKYVKS